MGWTSLYEIADCLEIIPTRFMFNLDYLNHLYKKFRHKHQLFDLPSTLYDLSNQYRQSLAFSHEVDQTLQRFDRVIKRTARITRECGYTKSAFLLQILKLFSSPLRQLLSADEALEQESRFLFDRELSQSSVTLLESILSFCKVLDVVPRKCYHAMGWSGADDDTRILLRSKIQHVDQTAWLYSHSAMKHPNDLIKKHVYRDTFITGDNAMPFGRYKKETLL